MLVLIPLFDCKKIYYIVTHSFIGKENRTNNRPVVSYLQTLSYNVGLITK